MLYHGNNPILSIVGVARMRWEQGDFTVLPRPYSVLALRIKGTAEISGQFVGERDVLYLPQGLGYTARYTDTELIAVHFVTAHSDLESEVYASADYERLYPLFLQLLDLWQEKAPGHGVFALSILYRILGTLMKAELTQHIPAPFSEALSYMNSHFQDPVCSIPAVCKASGISETALRLCFRTYYEKSPLEYLTDLRLEHSSFLLANGATVEQAAYQSGFNDPKYFARVVKRKMNCTPRQLKNYGK